MVHNRCSQYLVSILLKYHHPHNIVPKLFYLFCPTVIRNQEHNMLTRNTLILAEADLVPI